jgi:hypothetical protein
MPTPSKRYFARMGENGPYTSVTEEQYNSYKSTTGAVIKEDGSFTIPNPRPAEFDDDRDGEGNFIVPSLGHGHIIDRCGPQTLEGLAETIMAHYRDNPKHGTNCACLGEITRAAWMELSIPGTVSDYIADSNSVEYKFKNALSHVLVLLARRVDWY